MSSKSKLLDPEFLINLIDSLKGLTLKEATDTCGEKGFTIRVVRKDDVPYVGTRDYRTDRINIQIVNNKVINAFYG